MKSTQKHNGNNRLTMKPYHECHTRRVKAKARRSPEFQGRGCIGTAKSNSTAILRPLTTSPSRVTPFHVTRMRTKEIDVERSKDLILDRIRSLKQHLRRVRRKKGKTSENPGAIDGLDRPNRFRHCLCIDSCGKVSKKSPRAR